MTAASSLIANHMNPEFNFHWMRILLFVISLFRAIRMEVDFHMQFFRQQYRFTICRNSHGASRINAVTLKTTFAHTRQITGWAIHVVTVENSMIRLQITMFMMCLFLGGHVWVWVSVSKHRPELLRSVWVNKRSEKKINSKSGESSSFAVTQRILKAAANNTNKKNDDEEEEEEEATI